MKYELNDAQVQNALVLLDRVQTKGFAEAEALLTLRQIFSNPAPEVVDANKG